MMTMKSKGSLLVTLGILLTVGIASLIVSSESFAEEVGQTNIGVTFYGGKEPLKTEGSSCNQRTYLRNYPKSNVLWRERATKNGRCH